MPASSPSPLYATAVGTETAAHTLVMLHGIYGRGRNWQAIAKSLTASRPDWRALLVDLRLHGQSPALGPPHTVLAAADDVRALIEAGGGGGGAADGGRAGVRAVLGHSFGGKVALALARPPVIPSLRQVWVIDSTPEAKPPAGSAWDMLLHVRSLPDTFAARTDLVAALEHFGWPTGVAQWMATNLRYDDGRYVWALDFDAMRDLLDSFFQTDLWDIVEHPPAGVHLHVVKALASSTLTDAACNRLEAAGTRTGQVHLHRLPGGHWLNADNPQGIVDLLTTHLD